MIALRRVRVVWLMVPLLCGETPALACACCTSAGQRTVGTDPINAYAAGLLDEIVFANSAHLVMGAADVGTMRGIAATKADFDLDVTKTGARWKLEFGAAGSDGTLTFSLPRTVTKFEVDPRSRESDEGKLGPVLYKEWRLTTKAVGTGMFTRAAKGGQQITLVLHGRGNSCTDASQFTAWTLVLHDGRPTVTLYGELTSGTR